MMGEKHAKNKNMFHAHFDFKRGDLHHVLFLLKRAYPSNSIQVLFQHPSPALADRSSYAIAGKHCIDALEKKYVTSIFFVYDVNTKSNKESNCWSRDSLLKCVLSMTQCERLHISEECLISGKEEDRVQHPIFNNIRRKGWAFLRKGEEYYFSFTYS